MRLLIQRVKRASVTVDDKVIGQIGTGYMVLWGVKDGDGEKEADYLARKLVNLRVFSDEDDKMNQALTDVSGGVLIVSQFTLYADCHKGNRPNFMKAMKGEESEKLYEYFVEQVRKQMEDVQTGKFGADMAVELVNDGPVTILMDTEEMM